MPLTDAKIKSLKPGPQPRKHSDGGGLHLLVSTDVCHDTHLIIGSPKIPATLQLLIYRGPAIRLRKTR